MLDLTPKAPAHITYKNLWAAVLTKHAVRVTEVNAICARLKKKYALVFLDWEAGKRSRRITTACNGRTASPEGLFFLHPTHGTGAKLQRRLAFPTEPDPRKYVASPLGIAGATTNLTWP